MAIAATVKKIQNGYKMSEKEKAQLRNENLKMMNDYLSQMERRKQATAKLK